MLREHAYKQVITTFVIVMQHHTLSQLWSLLTQLVLNSTSVSIMLFSMH